MWRSSFKVESLVNEIVKYFQDLHQPILCFSASLFTDCNLLSDHTTSLQITEELLKKPQADLPKHHPKLRFLQIFNQYTSTQTT